MNHDSHRAIFVEGVIVVAACVGAWLLWVQPATEKLARIEAENQHAQQAGPAPGEQAVVDLAGQAGRVAARVKDVTERSAASRDITGIYRRFSDLARAHGVVVLSLSPGDAEARRHGDSLEPDLVRINLTVQGRYEAMARFLEAIDRAAGYSRLASLELSVQEDDGGSVIHGQIVCETLSFPLPPALAAAIGGDHAHP